MYKISQCFLDTQYYNPLFEQCAAYTLERRVVATAATSSSDSWSRQAAAHSCFSNQFCCKFEGGRNTLLRVLFVWKLLLPCPSVYCFDVNKWNSHGTTVTKRHMNVCWGGESSALALKDSPLEIIGFSVSVYSSRSADPYCDFVKKKKVYLQRLKVRCTV